MSGALTPMKPHDETVVYWFDDWPLTSELDGGDESHRLPFFTQDFAWMNGRYVMQMGGPGRIIPMSSL